MPTSRRRRRSPSRPSCSAAPADDADAVVSVLLLGVACTGPLPLAARGGLSDATKSAGVLIGLWLVGVSFDPGAGHLLMWVGVVAGGCVITTHAAFARATP